jgi:hypothetical protein
MMDKEFKLLCDPLKSYASPTGLHTSPKDEAAPQVERYISTIKERSRRNVNSVPFWIG